MEWKEINTAPKDCSSILGYAPGKGIMAIKWMHEFDTEMSEIEIIHTPGQWIPATFYIEFKCDPEDFTHWMEIPELPRP